MQRSDKILVLFVSSFVLAGAVEVHTLLPGQLSNEVSVVHIFVIAVLCFAWCKANVTERSIKEPPGSALLLAIFPPLGLPMYMYRSRNLKDATIGVLKGFGLFIVAATGYAAAWHISAQIAA